jgi:type III secretion system FlhB-like substrate exporter
VNKPKNFGLQADHAQVANLSDLDIQIAIVLGIYFVIMLVIALLAHLLTRKYNDK